MPEPQCKYTKSESELGFKKMFLLSLAPVIVGGFISILGIRFLTWAFDSKEAEFVYVDSGVQEITLIKTDHPTKKDEKTLVDHITIILENVGDRAGIITAVKVNDVLKTQFYASHTVTDVKLRKQEYQKSEALVCPPKTYCEISFEGSDKIVSIEISNGKAFEKLKI